MQKLENDMLSFSICFSKWAELTFQHSINIERNVLPIFSFNANEESGLDKVIKFNFITFKISTITRSFMNEYKIKKAVLDKEK